MNQPPLGDRLLEQDDKEAMGAKVIGCFNATFVRTHGIVPFAIDLGKDGNVQRIIVISDRDDSAFGIVRAEVSQALRRGGFQDVRVEVRPSDETPETLRRYKAYMQHCDNLDSQRKKEAEERYRSGEHISADLLPKRDVRIQPSVALAAWQKNAFVQYPPAL